MKHSTSVNALRLRSILESSLYADDIDQAEAFYRDALGLDLMAREANRHLFFRCGSQMLLVFNPSRTIEETDAAPHGAHGAGHVAFGVPLSELDEWESHLKERGIEIEKDVTWPNSGRSIYFRDPAGNCLELASPLIRGMAESDVNSNHPLP